MPGDNSVHWIEKVLVPRIADSLKKSGEAIVEKCEVSPLEGNKDNWASVMFAVKFGLQLSEERKQINVLVKLMVEDESIRHSLQSDKQFSNEIHFYSTMVPFVLSHVSQHQLRVRLEALFPKCYYSSFLSDSKTPSPEDGIVVMENLKPLGFKLGHRESLDLKHLMIAVDRLGALHAMSYFLKEKHPKEFYEKIVPPIFETMILPKLKEDVHNSFNGPNIRVLQALEKELPDNHPGLERLRKATHDPYSVMLKLIQPKEPLATVCHGDFLRNNVLFRYEGDEVVDMKMLDFQTVRYTSPAIDLSLMLLINSTHDVRVGHLEALLKKYHESLISTLRALLGEMPKAVEERYSYEAFVEDFKQHVVYGYFITVNFLPWMYAEEDDLAELVKLWKEENGSEAYKLKLMTVGGERSTEALASVAKDLMELGYL